MPHSCRPDDMAVTSMLLSGERQRAATAAGGHRILHMEESGTYTSPFRVTRSAGGPGTVGDMGMYPKMSRKARWMVPAGALAVTGGLMAAALMPSAQAAPALPARTPAQLLADVAAQSHIPALSGTVVETTSLGLPRLPGTQSSTSLISLLTGSHTIN